jgi:hypothetical protein
MPWSRWSRFLFLSPSFFFCRVRLRLWLPRAGLGSALLRGLCGAGPSSLPSRLSHTRDAENRAYLLAWGLGVAGSIAPLRNNGRAAARSAKAFFFPVFLVWHSRDVQGEKVDLKTLVNQDAGDESLRKYKEALLGNVANTYSPKDDPRRVVITQLKIVVEGKWERVAVCDWG